MSALGTLCAICFNTFGNSSEQEHWPICSPFSPQQQLKAVLNLSVRLKLVSQNTAGPWCLTCKLTTTILSQNLTLNRVLSQSTSASSEERVDLLVALLLLLLVIIWPGRTKARGSLKVKKCTSFLFFVCFHLVACHQLVHRWFGGCCSL